MPFLKKECWRGQAQWRLPLIPVKRSQEFKFSPVMDWEFKASLGYTKTPSIETDTGRQMDKKGMEASRQRPSQKPFCTAELSRVRKYVSLSVEPASWRLRTKKESRRGNLQTYQKVVHIAQKELKN